MPTLRQTVGRLRVRWILPPSGTVSVKDLNQRFQPVPPGSLRSLLLKMNTLADMAEPVGGSIHPYYRRSMPAPFDASKIDSNSTHIDLTNVHLPPYSLQNSVAKVGDHSLLNPVAEAVRLFDARAAAAVSAATGFGNGVSVFPSGNPETELTELLEEKDYNGVAPTIYIPKAKCLAALAYPDFFPDVHADGLRPMVSEAILASSPGWCGTIGPAIHDTITFAFVKSEGNYDISQMHLLQIAYRYYDDLWPEAQKHLITSLLAQGRIHRVDEDDTFTSSDNPNDYSRAGFISPHGFHRRIGETENHILLILTARYLTNQLLYQRDQVLSYDNRRNGQALVFGILVRFAPPCTELLLTSLRNILSDDFSEYNAKPYQTETRSALLNLCSYAYDHEVRLAARMVLDYISAHIAVSSNDLRRMVPFRRRNEEKFGRNKQFDSGFMDVGLVEWFLGADPMAEHFAMQAGNTRVYETPSPDRPWSWAIASDGGDATIEALSDYRLPPSIHDLFVNDLHRRFFQRLHRVIQPDVELTGRNCDNMEIYAGSPSYLISAGGEPADYAIDPHFAGYVVGDQNQQLGVAVTTSFMPTGQGAGINIQNARDLIQFSSFSSVFSTFGSGVANYGVAPDFACGYRVHLPRWCLDAINPDEDRGNFVFVNRGSAGRGPGFYLALFRDGDFAAMEAFDTWLHPGLTFEQFRTCVWKKNSHLSLNSNVEAHYTTHNGNSLRFVIWNGVERNHAACGATILSIEYGKGDPPDCLGDAGNITDKFLNGTILNNTGEATVEISNPLYGKTGTKIILDMSDPKRPKRTSETGEVEEAGSNHEVWVNFGWKGPYEGDFFQPFNTIAAAAAAVADGGVIKIMPGWTNEKPFLAKGKRMRLVAPIGNVTFGVR